MLPRLRASVTITYKRVDGGLITSRVGYGHTIPDAVMDADSQLKPGIWTRILCSTPDAVLRDVKGRTSKRVKPQDARHWEGKEVVIPAPRYRKSPGRQLTDD